MTNSVLAFTIPAIIPESAYERGLIPAIPLYPFEPKPTCTHQDLIALHRHRFHIHATAALDPKRREIKLQDDCGVSWKPVDRHFVEAMEARLLAPVDRRELCERLARGETIPELDCALSAYVVRLTGKQPQS
jgi:hypothetical protein